MIEMYTDGAAKGNPGPGGYGTILIYKSFRKEITAGFRKTTNNRMELLAVIVGLEALKKEGSEVKVVSDSKYVVDAVQKGWVWNWVKTDFKNKKNADLWRKFIDLYKKHQVKLQWIKGHAGHPENERCDQLAVLSATSPNLLIDEGFESGKYN